VPVRVAQKLGEIVVIFFLLLGILVVSALTMLDCIFVRNLNRCVRPVILNLFAVL